MPSLKERWEDRDSLNILVQYIIAVSIVVFLGILGPYLIISAKYQYFFNPF